MELDPSGKVRAYEIRPTAIRSREKLSYPQVQAYFNRKGFRTKDALEGKGSPVAVSYTHLDVYKRQGQ